MSGAFSELQKQHQASQDKYTYFLLAAAGACIAYATEKALGVPLNGYLSFLALSVLSWSASFYCGCKCASTVQALIRANANLLSLHADKHVSQPQKLELLSTATRSVRSAIETNMHRAKLLNEWQFRFFVTGGVLFVGWRISEIIRVAPQP